MIDELARDLVAEVLANPGCDVVQTLAIPMPIRMIAHILGVPDGDLDQFRRWSEAAIHIIDFAPNLQAITRSVKGRRRCWGCGATSWTSSPPKD